MSRPQATTAFIPISNRSGDRPRRPASVSSFMTPEKAAETHSWYNITSKKAADKVVAEVMVYGEIGWEVEARQFVKDLTLLEADQINVRINSVGGDVFDGVAIYNALRQKDAVINVYVEGLAASAASFIAQAGDEVIMLKGSQMMIHDASALAWGNEEVMLSTADVLRRISNSIADIYAQRAGGTAEDWRAIMQAEMWYSPEEAVQAGLADSVLSEENEDAQAAKLNWDLRVYNYAGRKEAPNPLEETRKIINRAKEAPVTVKNDTVGTVADPAPPETPPVADPADPEAPPVVEAEAEEESAEEEHVETPVAGLGGGTVVAQTGAFMVNGVQMSDPRAVQAHITMLESFMRETRETARKSFIENLAKPTNGSQPKIAATQIGAMEELVATMDDKQYGLWMASWEAAPNISLLGSHGDTAGGSPSGTAQAAATDRVELLKGIVNQHRLSGMKPENIKATDSYKELLTLEPDFTLDKK